MSARRPLADRFWEKVDKINGPIMPGMKTRCWMWMGAKSGGYGYIGLGDGTVGRATHVAWSLEHGASPTKCVLHHCDNPGCVNPDHLYEGTQKDNAADRETRRRGNHPVGDQHHARLYPERLARGASHGNALLSNEQAAAIRDAFTGRYGEQRALAKKYNVDVQTIRRVVQGKTYRAEA